jgi:hypothetical protein
VPGAIRIFPSLCAPNRGREGSDETIAHPPPMSRTMFVDSFYLVCRLSAWIIVLKVVTSWRIVPVASHPSHPAIHVPYFLVWGITRLLRIHHSVHDVTSPDPDLGARSRPGVPTQTCLLLLGFSGSHALETTFRLVSFRARTDTRFRRDFAKPNRKETLLLHPHLAFSFYRQSVNFHVVHTPPRRPSSPFFFPFLVGGKWVCDF